MLEGVLEIGEKLRLVEELRRLQPPEALEQLILSEPGDRLQDGPRHVLADDGRRACSRRLSSPDRRSMRAASRAWTLAGTWIPWIGWKSR
jgi:hypothetical protein